ncbi:kinase-like protein [Metschnikowia bicuspidata var. bicuspidata NRRL YB-4993]|uniref:non-specific serine/threonine protein kinase n=1 Tax=Metschnikowia bicuspidata var. bicuspidata NRRL YB-4993 TaxID=869754 RepID=A0A1A0H8P4_9ASCO|nr:kinase-like protein [Metschnikowia bicuspidata var. bicuspidata NRRL YB-4993]OBA20489.1 kinase-like protein [Metschnikowia bicuspidata var. bicuspidata NRRL YB-4993]
MSLTPAQRVEKRPGLRTKNALDDFEFYEKIGRGAYADVYRGLNTKTKKVVAIKQITLDKDYNPNALMGEIDLLKILKHPNIVKYHGFVKTLDSLNVFLEFCAGGSLRQIYKKQGHGFLESQIISYVNPILKGLQYLHEQGVVHRDVKAANVLLTGSGEVKLADFGVATKVSTLHNTVVGTPNWMAPETVLGGDGICTASDIWSLGATIIELFTMNPPYHELNPMATLHAIGTDEHPVLPTGLSPLAKDFLLECFQKQSNLRINAKLLLKHRWVNPDQHNTFKSSPSPANMNTLLRQTFLSTSHQGPEPVAGLHGPLHNFTITPPGLKSDEFTPATQVLNLVKETSDVPGQAYSRAELLAKFTEKEEGADENLFLATGDFADTLVFKEVLQKQPSLNLSDEVEENDPFFALDINNFDTSELEIQGKMEFLLSKLVSRVSSCHVATDDAINVLEKITGRMYYLVRKYPTSHDVLIRDHGILTLMELLENALDLADRHKLWNYVLGILNNLFQVNIAQIENFSLLGGIPMITRFSKLSFGLQIRSQVVKFVKTLRKSEKALLMFVSSGGLRILSRFLEEDFETSPDFSLVAVHCIHEILAKDLTRFKSDMCRILSKYGIVFWFVVLLNRLTKCYNQKKSLMSTEHLEATIDKILEVIKYFGQSEARVRINVSSPDLFKLLIKVYPSLSFHRQMELLKFFRSISCISELLRPLNSADILEFYVTLLRQYTPTHPQYKEVMNILCPSLYNCCNLNHSSERELAKLGAIPLLRDLSRINLPFRQFVLPILCELVYCDSSVRALLLKHDIPTIYFNLLVDPYWHYNVMDSILHWSSQNEGFNWLESATAKNCLVSGFMMNKVSNLEAVLENYLKLMTKNDQVVRLLARDSIIENILGKLNIYSKAPAAKFSLLRILHQILFFASDHAMVKKFKVLGSVQKTMSSIIAFDTSVLAKDLASRIVLEIGTDCR